MSKGYRAFIIGTLIFDVVFFLACIICLFAGVGSPVEWIIFIIMDLTAGFPCSIRLLNKYKAAEDTKKETK